MTDDRDTFDAALARLLKSEYQRGLEDGLQVADKICGWLTIQPPRKWAEQIHG